MEIKKPSGVVDLLSFSDTELNIYTHGERQSIQIVTSTGPITIDQSIAGRLIKNSAGYKSGQPIRLLSCETGACDKGFAQNLANKMGVPVQAPTDVVWAYPDGTTIVAPRLSNNPASQYFIQPNISQQGTFKTFLPKSDKP